MSEASKKPDPDLVVGLMLVGRSNLQSQFRVNHPLDLVVWCVAGVYLSPVSSASQLN
ncbi:MAG: hypothetical protein ACRC62_09510 [Microcoleus sp.]